VESGTSAGSNICGLMKGRPDMRSFTGGRGSSRAWILGSPGGPSTGLRAAVSLSNRLRRAQSSRSPSHNPKPETYGVGGVCSGLKARNHGETISFHGAHGAVPPAMGGNGNRARTPAMGGVETYSSEPRAQARGLLRKSKPARAGKGYGCGGRGV
jgi:hypothetical protein